MDVTQIRQLIELAKEQGLAKLEFSNDQFKCAVTLVGEQPMEEQRAGIKAPMTGAGARAEGSGEPEHFEVKSPFVGTFYAAPSPGAMPFVKVGDRVDPGRTLCVLEAMKIMNEIDAEVGGEIVEVCVEDESFVEFGEVLFRIGK